MPQIHLSQKLIACAAVHAKACGRSTSQQVEFWATVGSIGLEQPCLTMEEIVEIFLAEKQGDFEYDQRVNNEY